MPRGPIRCTLRSVGEFDEWVSAGFHRPLGRTGEQQELRMTAGELGWSGNGFANHLQACMQLAQRRGCRAELGARWPQVPVGFPGEPSEQFPPMACGVDVPSACRRVNRLRHRCATSRRCRQLRKQTVRPDSLFGASRRGPAAEQELAAGGNDSPGAIAAPAAN